MKKINRMISFICAIVLCVSMVIPTQAATYIKCGDADGKIAVKSYKDKYNDTWDSIIQKSIATWNESDANVKISVKANSNNEILVNKYNDTWYGRTTQTYNISTGYTSKFTIRVNKRTIKSAATNYSNFARSTLTHEFGHVFWLADNPDTNKASIMKYSRNRNKMVKPQAFDISKVNKKYK